MCKDICIRASPSELVNASASQTSYGIKDNKSLKRVFRLFDLIIFGVSLTVGSGIFIIAGTAGKYYAGSSLVLSLLIGGFSCMCTAFAHMEFASRIPIIGSVYTYVYNSSGEFLAFEMGFLGILDPLSASVNSIGAIGYFKSFLISCGVNRYTLDNSMWFGYKPDEASFFSINLAAPLLIFILTLFAIFDVSLSKNFINYFTIWNISLLLLFIMCGSLLIDTDIWIHPCDHIEFGIECNADANNSFFPYGINGTLSGALIACWAFMGVEQIVTVAEECVAPIKDIPRAIYISLLFVAILYVAVIMVMNGIVPFQALDTEASLSEALAVHNELLLHQMISLGASTTMSILSFASLIGTTRRWFRVGVDGLCFSVFAYVHPRFRTPFYIILLYSIIAMLFALLFDLGPILSFSAVGSLLNLTSVSVGLLAIRYSPPQNDNDTVYWWTQSKIIGLSWSFLLFCLVFCGIQVNKSYFDDDGLFAIWIILIVICALILCLYIGLFCYFHYKYPWKKWMEETRRYDKKHKIYYMPLCPYLPLMVIGLNSYLMIGMGLKMMLQLMSVWLLGIPIYFGYSYKHSKLRKRRLAKRVSSMIALTAYDHQQQTENNDARISVSHKANIETDVK